MPARGICKWMGQRVVAPWFLKTNHDSRGNYRKNGARLFVAPRVLGGLKTTLSLATSNNIYIDCFVARKEVIWLLFYHTFYHHGRPITMHLGSHDHCLFSLSFLPLALMDTQIPDASALASECKVCLKSFVGRRALQRQETMASLPMVTWQR